MLSEIKNKHFRILIEETYIGNLQEAYILSLKIECVDKSDLELIHESTLEILSDIGVKFSGQKALDIFIKNGAKVEGNTVFIDEQLLERALSSIPKSFILKGRTSDKDVLIGEENTAFAPASGPVFVTKGKIRKPATCDDFTKLTKLIETSKTLNIASAVVTEPQDIPLEKRNAFRIATCLKYSSKPFVGFTTGESDSKECINLVQDFVGSDESNLVMGIISAISPLTYDEAMIDGIFTYCEKKQPIVIACASMPGGTTPASICGTIVVNNAEVLAGVVLSQLVRPGAPVIYGNTSGSCDMRYVSPAIGSSETSLITMTVAELGRFYGIPTRSGGSLTDSKTSDMQAGVESAFTILPPILSKISFVLQSCGILESFNSMSFEKLVIDEATIEMGKRLSRGFNVSRELIGMETIKNIGHGGMFLNEMHTMKNFRDELHVSSLFSKDGYESWADCGSKSIDEVARMEVQRRLDEYIEIGISIKQEELLSKYLRI